MVVGIWRVIGFGVFFYFVDVTCKILENNILEVIMV